MSQINDMDGQTQPDSSGASREGAGRGVKPSEMVERVARAIYNAPNGIDGDCIGTMLYENERIEGPAERARERTLAVCREAARAAIEAMRELTPEVLEAVKWAIPGGHGQAWIAASDAWKAGVDAALERR